ncbi:MAG: hypothetical protein ACUVV6_06820 [Thermoplasmatota archaeon]
MSRGLVGTGKVCKGLEVYCSLALNRAAAQLGIDLNRPGLEERLDELIRERAAGLPKAIFSCELRANHHITEKALRALEEEGLEEKKEYRVRITKKGVLHLRKYNQLYSTLFRRYILDRYKYSFLPSWFTSEQPAPRQDVDEVGGGHRPRPRERAPGLFGGRIRRR